MLSSLASRKHGIGVGLALMVGACGSSPNESSDADTDGQSQDTGDDGDEGDSDEAGEDGGTGVEECYGLLEIGEGLVGDPCNMNELCESLVCEMYEAFGPEGVGQCGEIPPNCAARAMGNLRDVRTGELLPEAPVFFGPGAEIVQDPLSATHFADDITDELGRFDMTSAGPVNAFFAIAGVSQATGYEPSVVVLGVSNEAGKYGPSFLLRNWYAVRSSDANAWNQALARDPEMAPYVPLERNGGVVGLVSMYGESQSRVSGVAVEPMDPGSTALVRYVDESGLSFDAAATTSSGLVVIVDTEVGERFNATSDEVELWDPEGGARPGVVANGLYVMWVVVTPSRP